LNKPAPDRNVVAGALLNGRIASEDVDGMVWLYRHFRQVPVFSDALAYWNAGDRYILQLREIGTRLHALAYSGRPSDAMTPSLVDEIEAVDQQVTHVEDGFSRSLNEASHATRSVLIFALTSLALLLLSVVTSFMRRSFARGAQDAAQLVYQATHDELTDLLNRREFERRLASVLAQRADGAGGYAVMFLDLDQFKIVNDTCGHAAGDELIRQVGATLRASLSDQAVLARLGGDEFGVVLPHCATPDALRIAGRLCEAVAAIRLPWAERTLTTGVSIGLVGSCARLASLKEVMKAADVACYMAKENGRNRVHLFSLDDQALSATNTQMEWVARVKAALDDESLCLHAQRIEPLRRGTGGGNVLLAHDTHIEVLLRMKDASGSCASRLPRPRRSPTCRRRPR
jgi:diguanylate cyclase (GGDEF)-like protein